MLVDTIFRRMPSSPSLHTYARQKLAICEQQWKRSLDLRLAFTRDLRGVAVELCGRDKEGHFISCRGHGSDGYQAIDNLYHKLRPQGPLLASQATSAKLHPLRSSKARI